VEVSRKQFFLAAFERQLSMGAVQVPLKRGLFAVGQATAGFHRVQHRQRSFELADRATRQPTLDDAMMGQHYWSDFHTDPEAELALAYDLGNMLGIVVLPTLPGNAPGTWPLNTIAKFPGFCVWRDGTTPEQTLAQLGALQVAGLQTNKFPTPGGFP